LLERPHAAVELLAEEARRNARWVTLAQPPIAMCFLRRGARPRSTVAEQPFYIVGPIEKAVEKARQLAGEEEPEQAADEPAETPEEARGPSRPRSEWRRTERNVKVTLTIPRPRAPIVRTLMIQRIAPWAFDDAILRFGNLDAVRPGNIHRDPDRFAWRDAAPQPGDVHPRLNGPSETACWRLTSMEAGGLERTRTARTVDGHHWRPPCAVGTSSSLRARAISASPRPRAYSSLIRSTML